MKHIFYEIYQSIESFRYWRLIWGLWDWGGDLGEIFFISTVKIGRRWMQWWLRKYGKHSLIVQFFCISFKTIQLFFASKFETFCILFRAIQIFLSCLNLFNGQIFFIFFLNPYNCLHLFCIIEKPLQIFLLQNLKCFASFSEPYKCFWTV